MGKANPFYRFSQGWNSGFYPDNQIVSDLLNEIYVALGAVYPSWVTLGFTTLPQLKSIAKAFIDPYNAFPYYGNFSVEIDLVTSPPDYNFTLSIRDNSLYATDNSQQITIIGLASIVGKVISSSTLNAYTVASYTGTFDAGLIQEEQKASEAMEVVNLNGSAMFPITYSYDSTTGVATSGLARAKDLQLIDGVISRIPADTAPKLNQRTFQLPELNADDKYIVSIMERIIQASLIDDDYTTSILATYNSFQLPDNWTGTIFPSPYTTYERVQIDFIDASRRKFVLVGRKDGTSWLWQRFVSDFYLSPFNFFDYYTESTPLPYQPTQAGRWLYIYTTYDFDLVEFTSNCYTSTEFYAMPALPGDQWQFNVVDANLEGIDSVNVGLFSESGELIQKIGEATKLPDITCTEHVCFYNFSYTIATEDIDAYVEAINDNATPIVFIYLIYLNFYIYNSSNEIVYTLTGTESFNDDQFPVNITTIIAKCNSIGISTIQDESGVTFSWQINDLPCGDTYTFKHYTNNLSNVLLFSDDPYECECTVVTINQHQASVTIPSKKGCYRMGLYSDPATTCQLMFQYEISGEDLVDYLEIVNSAAVGDNPYLGFSPDNFTFDFFELTDAPYTAETLATAINTNIQNLVVTVTTDPEETMTFNYTAMVNCGFSYALYNSIVSESGGFQFPIFNSPTQECVCGTSYYLYSLSNIINIDASDCFSTILEFWADSNQVAQGFEYFDNWKQRVRIGLNGGGEKPVIEESLYRQSNGVHRRPQNKQDLSLDLHTDFFDLETQLAMTDATRHPYLIWEGKSIFVKGDIEVATTQDFTTQSSFETLSQMKFQALIQGFQPRNSSCLTC